MKHARFRFFAELNDFLPQPDRFTEQLCTFQGNQSIKHLIESLGIPHPEVAVVRVNGCQEALSTITHDGDLVEAYPVDTEQWGVAEPGLPVPGFVLDNHLGRLAMYLRMLGLDTLYRNDYQDDELACVAHEQERVLLTRDRRLLMRSLVTQGYWLRSQVPKEQLVEVLRRFGLPSRVTPFTRCLRCNGVLRPVAKEVIVNRLQPLTQRYFDEFSLCPDCQQIYWQGSHHDHMQALIDAALGNAKMRGSALSGTIAPASV